MSVEPTPAASSDTAPPDTGYFPTRDQMRAVADALDQPTAPPDMIQFAPGMLCRTDELPVDENLAMLTRMRRDAEAAGDTDKAERYYHLQSRTESVNDITLALYQHFASDPSTIANWYPPLYAALTAQGDQRVFRTPGTTIARLPPELAQFIRIEYPDTTPASRAMFNDIIYDMLGLEDDKVYFIKTGTFSSKFEFANARCAEPREMGEYLQVVNNFAMTVGAGRSVDVCARDYIEPEPGTPTIYHGMPLRCEFRVFVDFDADEVLGVTPYWHPSVMRRALALAEAQGMAHLVDDARVYDEHLPVLTTQFVEYRDRVAAAVTDLLPLVDLPGCWSVDVMLDRGNLWLIDMATMNTSALVDVLLNTDEYALVDADRIRKTQALPEAGYPQKPMRTTSSEGAVVPVAGPFVRRFPALN